MQDEQILRAGIKFTAMTAWRQQYFSYFGQSFYITLCATLNRKVSVGKKTNYPKLTTMSKSWKSLSDSILKAKRIWICLNFINIYSFMILAFAELYWSSWNKRLQHDTTNRMPCSIPPLFRYYLLSSFSVFPSCSSVMDKDSTCIVQWHPSLIVNAKDSLIADIEKDSNSFGWSIFRGVVPWILWSHAIATTESLPYSLRQVLISMMVIEESQ